MTDEYFNDKIDMIDEGLEYMLRILGKIDDVCSGLKRKENLDNIVPISEGLLAIVQIIKYTNSVNKIEVDEESIAEFINDIVDGMENGDFNLVSDILEYEIKPLYEDWSEVFGTIIESNKNA